MRRPIIAGNWKMYLGAETDAVTLANGLVESVGRLEAVDVVLGPPFTALCAVVQAVKGSRITVAAQNCYPKENGAYTGEIAPPFIKEAGARAVIIGHSERRQYFAETDAFINEKVQAAHQYGLTPIMCCGETGEERLKGVTETVVRRHIVQGLAGLSPDQLVRTVIAYEPVWAIGTGLTATPADAQAVHAFIRGLLAEGWGADAAQRVRIQYGGSVKPDNARELLQQPDIDGALVGGASLKVDSFTAIVLAAL